jgi:hypothetical protein
MGETNVCKSLVRKLEGKRPLEIDGRIVKINYLVYWFIYGLFNNVVSSSDFIVPNNILITVEPHFCVPIIYAFLSSETFFQIHSISLHS